MQPIVTKEKKKNEEETWDEITNGFQNMIRENYCWPSSKAAGAASSLL